jgi:hypothetical protein
MPGPQKAAHYSIGSARLRATPVRGTRRLCGAVQRLNGGSFFFTPMPLIRTYAGRPSTYGG